VNSDELTEQQLEDIEQMADLEAQRQFKPGTPQFNQLRQQLIERYTARYLR